jgi:hypothetical protein
MQRRQLEPKVRAVASADGLDAASGGATEVSLPSPLRRERRALLLIARTS